MTLRRELFHTYQPRTRDEADCVDGVAGYKWRIARCQRRQAVYEAHLDAVLAGNTDGSPVGHVCEPDPHRWQHRSMDCVLEEQRLHKLMTKDRATLFELQRMRRNRLIDGAIAVTPSHLEFLGEEEPSEPEHRAAQKEGPVAAKASNDGRFEGILERNPAPPRSGIPAARDGARDPAWNGAEARMGTGLRHGCGSS
jgi:hypothetical protein